MALIELRDLQLTFGDKTILDGFNLSVSEGETVVIAGPSGSGKSLILKLCLGLIKPTAGHILIDGSDVGRMSERELNGMRMNAGMLFQNYGLLDSMTVAENVGFFLKRHTRKTDSEIHERVKEVLHQVDLEGVENLKPVELSGGMKKRVGIARAIAHHPKIVYYDEPTAGLDPVTSDLINDLILEMKACYGVTSLSISNEMACAYAIGDRVGILYQGKLTQIDTPERIRNSTDPVVHQFVNGLEEGPIEVH
jgi:phospholipid/cholesterol/gamma-HCH transport system ATP-binding protein